MSRIKQPQSWNILPPATIQAEKRMDHVRRCSDFAAGLLDRFPKWAENLDEPRPPDVTHLVNATKKHGLNTGLRRFRNREMLRIVWRDLCGLATLGETFESLTVLAEICLQTAIEEHHQRLKEKQGTPRGGDGEPQRIFVIALGKFGGRELNLSSDIDIIFCYEKPGICDGRRGMANDQFFTRLARAVIASLSEATGDGFCFRVDTRLRPFGDSGPLVPSLPALEQYYQREGRDWERYALIKARPVAGDLEAGSRFIENVRPFVYRRYIDYGSVEALQEMHTSVQEDAKRKNRLDDVKRGPGGIREIEFLTQCFQLLRGGREVRLQTASLDGALTEIGKLGLLDQPAINEIRNDYVFLRLLENRIQALRDQQTHRLPEGEDRERIALAMYEKSAHSLEESMHRTRTRVSERFQGIFPSRPTPAPGHKGSDLWRHARTTPEDSPTEKTDAGDTPLAMFVRRLDRVALSQRANQRLDRFMPELLERIDQKSLGDDALNRVFDLVLTICRRSAYLVLMVQHPQALDRLLELFELSEWVAAKVIRFPVLLDELIDPSLGKQIPGPAELERSVERILKATQGVEAVLESLNYLKLATELRVGVSLIKGNISAAEAQATLSDLASVLLRGTLEIAGQEIEARHGTFPTGPDASVHQVSRRDTMAIIGYGTLGAGELGFDSDLDIVFLFESGQQSSDGARPLSPEQYHARLAQRVLSFLTVMTPSGRLYEVDTRLRPNGRAGSLVSSITAFRDYQLNQAWTWELQALTRARHVAGSQALAAMFNRIRQEVLCRQRDEKALSTELIEMRRKMTREHANKVKSDQSPSPKHRPGGLIDIEFIAQLGVLCSARLYPRVLQATGTLPQLDQLMSIGWLTQSDASALEDTMQQLRQRRMMASLVPTDPATIDDTSVAARIFESRMGAAAPED
jgi:glutamate-ammonia-ligase adenylyltransferase